MFGLFKNRNQDSFNTLAEFRNYCQKEFEKEAISFYEKSPLRGGPLEANAILEGLINCNDKLKNRIPEIAIEKNWDKQKIEDEIRNAHRHVYDKYIKN